MRTAFVLLTIVPHNVWINFLNKLQLHIIEKNEIIDIYIMVDDNRFRDTNKHIHENIKVLQYERIEVVSKGYNNSSTVTINNDCISWDKAIYHFCEKVDTYDFVWFVEDDVLIPTIDSIVQMTNKYNSYDLIVPEIITNVTGELESWHWKQVRPDLQLPWYKTMVCALGVSNLLLQHIKRYVNFRKTIPFIEYIFVTMAKQNNMNIIVAPELEQIVYTPHISFDDPKFVSLVEKKYWIHPQKNMDIHKIVHNIN